MLALWKRFDKEDLERIEKLALRDLKVTRKDKPGHEQWYSPKLICPPPAFELAILWNETGASQIKASDELVIELKKMLHKNQFNIKFHFRGLELIDIEEFHSDSSIVIS